MRCTRSSLDRAYTCLEETPDSCSEANLERAFDCVEDMGTRTEACWTLLDARVFERAVNDAVDDRCAGLL
ncbi:MAG: hypothetical protein EA398_02355 [Deltaproteobacteria bacterium]|nr:MAG: hypothetical protein EA398_02355 [Deltaproteobacteria bacterium]